MAAPGASSLLRTTAQRLAVLAVLWLALGRILSAQESAIPKDRHPWMRHPIRSWKLVRVTTETLGRRGRVMSTNVTESRTTLTAADAEGYDLKVEVTVDVEGKRISSEPKTVRQSWLGDGAGEKRTAKRLGDRAMKIGDEKWVAETTEFEFAGGENRRILWLYTNKDSLPYVLGRRSLVYDSAGKTVRETQVETIEHDVPKTLLGARLITWTTKTTQRHPEGKVVTTEVHSNDVPGGVVEHKSEEFDQYGKLLRRSELELLDYGPKPDDR